MNGKLPFLDTPLHHKNNGSVDIASNPHNDRYLNFSSHHPRHVKEDLGMVSCPFHWAWTIAQGENIQVEEDQLRGVLKGNRYPQAFAKMASRPHIAREAAEEPRATAFIPYVASLSKNVRRSNSVYPLCCRPKWRCETGMQKIQHQNSLQIGIYPLRTADKSQGPWLTGEEVGSCVPDPLQLQPCVYRGDEETLRDPH